MKCRRRRKITGDKMTGMRAKCYLHCIRQRRFASDPETRYNMHPRHTCTFLLQKNVDTLLHLHVATAF